MASMSRKRSSQQTCSDTTYSDAFNAIDESVLLTDANQHIIFVNPTFTRITGYTLNDLRGKNCNLLQGPDTSIQTVTNIRVALAAGLAFHGEILNYCKDGAPFWNELSITPVRDTEGNITNFVAIQRDFTERKATEATLQDNTQRLQRLSDFNALMAQVNESIATSLDEQQLLQDVCDLAIRYAHLELAVIARPDASGRFQYPVSAGKTAFLDDLQVSSLLASLDPNIPEGQGAYANVWREEQPLFIDSVLSAAFAQHWYEHFRRFDIKSYAVLPLFHQGQIFGLFALYHSEENIFDLDLSTTLTELAHDISRGLDHLDLIRQERAEFNFNEALLNNLASGVSVIRYPDRVIERVNARLLDIYGVSSAEVLLGHSTRALFSDIETSQKIWEFAQTVLAQGSGILHDVPYRRQDGALVYVDLSGQKLSTITGEPDRIVWTCLDVTEHHQLMDDLSRQSLSDLLTGLPNRRALDLEIDRAMSRGDRNEKLLAVCMLDLDDFKPVNDTYGHDAGDMVLQIVAQRLKEALRKTDFVARLGGDEFVLLVEDLNHLGILDAILDKVVAAIHLPMILEGGQTVSVSLSMGVSIYPWAEGGNLDALLRVADQALYENKAHKTDRLRFWTLHGEHTPQRENKGQNLLRNGGLRVFYQPILGNHGRTIIGIEALARLQDSDGRILLPVEFLPMLNNDDLFELSSRVLDQSLRDLEALDQNTALSVSVNIDPRNVADASVIWLRDRIAGGGIEPKRIYLEILEGSNFDDQSFALAHLDNLKAMGICLALDDIGSAYSSLLRLKDLPIDKKNLYQGFIQNLKQKPRDLYFVQSMHALANGLGLELVVEGVETDDILDAMMMLGIPSMQGYAIAHPMPFNALRDFLLHAPSHHRTRPTSLLGLYAKQLANHNVLKKAILQNPHLIDRKTLLDACTCPIHHDLNQLHIPDGDIIHSLHQAYHHAIVGMSDLLVVTPTSDDWSTVDEAHEALQKAIITEYRKRKPVADRGVAVALVSPGRSA
jgi:diguanylate cyclase (GGDEF)-like protein/PAS domain S-box-containing protein